MMVHEGFQCFQLLGEVDGGKLITDYLVNDGKRVICQEIILGNSKGNQLLLYFLQLLGIREATIFLNQSFFAYQHNQQDLVHFHFPNRKWAMFPHFHNTGDL